MVANKVINNNKVMGSLSNHITENLLDQDSGLSMKLACSFIPVA
jgi:hypothetical protein